MQTKIITAKEFLAELESGRSDFEDISVYEPIHPWEIERRLSGEVLTIGHVMLKPGLLKFNIKGAVNVAEPPKVSLLTIIAPPAAILLTLIFIILLIDRQ